jgi:HEAT repeat protein
MSRRLAALLLLLVPGLAQAQFGSVPPPDQGTRNPLGSRLNAPAARAQSKVKLDEALRNFNSDDETSRLEGVQQLGQTDDEAKAVGYLLQAANDSDMAIRLKAVDVLGGMHAKDAVGPLVQQLFMVGTETTTKQHILVALGKIGDARATKPILDFLARDGDRGLRGNAIFALGDIGDKEALDPLQRIAGDGTDPTLRSLAESAVHKIKSRPAPEVVPSALAQERRRAGGPGGPADSAQETP